MNNKEYLSNKLTVAVLTISFTTGMIAGSLSELIFGHSIKLGGLIGIFALLSATYAIAVYFIVKNSDKNGGE